MPFGDFVNQLPPIVFLVIHTVAFLLGAFFASRAFSVGRRQLAWAFVLFAAAEISYMTYHLDWTTFLFAHTISEVLDLAAFAIVFVVAVGGLRRSVTAATQ